MAELRLPAATYRLQFGPHCGFARARDLVPYLHELGVTDLYASPLLASRSGSTHGYDVVDPTRLDPGLGSAREFEEMVAALRERGMGLLLDIVPNHMAAGPENGWWMDVLEHGPGSEHAPVFDIDWEAGEPILLPVLGAPHGEVLEAGELRVALENGRFMLCYHEGRYPLDAGTWGGILPGAPDAGFEALRRDIESLPPRAWGDAGERRARCRAIHEALADRLRREPEARGAIDSALQDLNGQPGEPRSFDRLDALLRRQAYRLAHWRIGAEVINYRRFFDIGDLVSVRIEDAAVFERTHALILRLAREGKVTGLRIDHIDGLLDPPAYLARLQGALGASPGERAFYVVAEKILTGPERLRRDWPLHGTTGYEFLDALNGVFVDPAGLQALDQIYTRFIGRSILFADLLYAQKKRVIDELFAADLHRLTAELLRLAAGDRHGRDLSPRELSRGLVEITACLPVYRTYIRSFTVDPEDRAELDVAFAAALRRATELEVAYDAPRRRAGDLDAGVVAFLRRVLTLDLPADAPQETRDRWLRFVMRWQQQTGPDTAKGLEDTALYQYNRLLSLNYVGGEPDPDPAALTAQAFHDHNRLILESWPGSLTSTSTHDSKRSEGVRARLYVLSEIPGEWERALGRWSRLNRPHKQEVGGRLVPGPNQEILLYQSLLGAWPLVEEPGGDGAGGRPAPVPGDGARNVLIDAAMPEFRDRVKRYVIKAAREAKVRTSWLDPDEPHEEALLAFVDAILDEGRSAAFLRDFRRFEQRLAWLGALNSLSQTLLKVASPGVPDIYQGTELWNLRLVDPDNRFPVDFESQAAMLNRLREADGGDAPIGTAARAGAAARHLSGLCADLVRTWTDGRIKMYTLYRALRQRRRDARLFREGDYLPLDAEGSRAAHLCAFARRLGDDWIVCAVPMRVASLVGPRGAAPLGRRVWKSTRLRLPAGAPARWYDLYAGATHPIEPDGSLPAAALLRSFPVALLRSAP